MIKFIEAINTITNKKIKREDRNPLFSLCIARVKWRLDTDKNRCYIFSEKGKITSLTI